MRGRSRATKLNGLLDDTHRQGAEMMGPCSIWRRFGQRDGHRVFTVADEFEGGFVVAIDFVNKVMV